MTRLGHDVLCISIIATAFALQSLAQDMPSRPAPKTEIRDYIRSTWNGLTRSTEMCQAFRDSKLSEPSSLFLPAELPITPELRALEQRCGIKVLHLPKQIKMIGDLKVASLQNHGLLFLPHPYVVPGGRFNEMYGWDSYFIELGLLADGRKDLAKDLVNNFIFEVEHYGGVLNANRTYYLSRSQPPFLTSMILAWFDDGGNSAERAKGDLAWLDEAYAAAVKSHALWTMPAHRAGSTGLARYFDFENGPVPEMSDDDAYYQKVVQWFIDHPEQRGNLLVSSTNAVDMRTTEHCDARLSLVCSKAHIGQYWLSTEFFKGDRADRESGFDTTFRFGPYAGYTHQLAPVCLNSLLYRYEIDLARIAHLLGKEKETAFWSRTAERRRAAINRFLWNPRSGLYVDYDFVHGRQSDYLSIASFYPLWAGIPDAQQADDLLQNLSRLDRAHGLSSSNFDSGLQWDDPFGWAPCNWLVVDGLIRYGYRNQAESISDKFTTMVETNYEREGTIREKYDVVSGTTTISVQNGYSANVEGFGWTNGVYLLMKDLDPRHF
ncbi:MAG TPA: trehalase family glycosidase [Terracidiphilus sp.]|nr:trehalase family glycosidase [Terracidiphilus sp.]